MKNLNAIRQSKEYLEMYEKEIEESIPIVENVLSVIALTRLLGEIREELKRFEQPSQQNYE